MGCSACSEACRGAFMTVFFARAVTVTSVLRQQEGDTMITDSSSATAWQRLWMDFLLLWEIGFFLFWWPWQESDVGLTWRHYLIWNTRPSQLRTARTAAVRAVRAARRLRAHLSSAALHFKHAAALHFFLDCSISRLRCCRYVNTLLKLVPQVLALQDQLREAVQNGDMETCHGICRITVSLGENHSRCVWRRRLSVLAFHCWENHPF